MRTSEFLGGVFHSDDRSAHEFVRFLLISRANPWPGTVKWLSTEELYTAIQQDKSSTQTTIQTDKEWLEKLLGHQLDNVDLYFTPHAFSREDTQGDRIKKSDATPTTRTLWVECDDTTLDPTRFKPEPSVIIETSPKRHHVYWFLNEPLDVSEVESYNRRLIAHNALEKDTSGWHLVKLMRVPGLNSYKRPEPHPVQIVTSNNASSTLRRYPLPILNQALEQTPDPGTIEIDLSSNPIPQPPLPTHQELFDKYGTSITKEVKQFLVTKQADRSTTLWRMYKVLAALGIKIEDAYALLQGTPNDKFAEEWRYNGEVGLWRDLQRGYASFQSGDVSNEDPTTRSAVNKKLSTVRTAKQLNQHDKLRRMAELIFEDLRSNGRMYWYDAAYEAYYYDGAKSINVDPGTNAWKYILGNYEIAEGSQEFKTITSIIWHNTGRRGESITPRTFSHYDSNHNVLYIYNNRGKVYRLDGTNIDIVDNGTDGVFFVQSLDHEEFWPDIQTARDAQSTAVSNGGNEVRHNGMPGRSQLTDLIFANPNYTFADEHTKRLAADIFRYWTYSIFFPALMKTRPHLVITGPAGSGKTLSFQLIQNLLQGPGKTVAAMPLDRANFETAASNRPFVFFDNVDTPNKWFTDALAEASTGISFSRRVLYTTNDLVMVHINCFIGLTTRDVWFSRPDVAQRVIVLHVGQRQDFTPAERILDSVNNNRNYVWALMLADLNLIIAEQARRLNPATNPGIQPHPQASTLRMADFARFIDIAGSADGLTNEDKSHLYTFMQEGQQNLLESGSLLYEVISEWLRATDKFDEPANLGRKLTPTRMRDELSQCAALHNNMQAFEQRYRSTKALIMGLREIEVLTKRDGYIFSLEDTSNGTTISYRSQDESKTDG